MTVELLPWAVSHPGLYGVRVCPVTSPEPDGGGTPPGVAPSLARVGVVDILVHVPLPQFRPELKQKIGRGYIVCVEF